MLLRPLPEHLQKKAEFELNEVPERREDDISHIRNWLAQQPHLNVVADDQWILIFLRSCKFSLQRTKEKLDLFYTVRTIFPELYSDRDPLSPTNQEVLKLGLLLPLSKTADPNGPRIILARCENIDPSKPMISLLRVYIMIVDILLKEDDNFIVAGVHLLVDLKPMTIPLMAVISPTDFKKLIICMEDAYPTRPKGFHLINTPSFVRALVMIIKQLMNVKNRSRFYAYTAEDCKEMYKTIPRSVLPAELGGESSSVADLTDYWKKKVESYRGWFLDDEKYHSNESMRPIKPKTSTEDFGLEGSFRKLNVD